MNPPPVYYPPTPPPVYYPPAPAPAPIPVPPPAPLPSQQQDSRNISVARSVLNETLSLRSLADINSAYRGWEVTAVRAATRSNSPAKTVATLLSNGVAMASQTNPGSQIYLVPQRKLTLGEVSALDLAISGGTYIDTIQVDLRYDSTKIVTINLARSVSNNEVIDLTQYDEIRYQAGRSVDQVFVTASSPSGGSVLIALNNTSLGQPQFPSLVTEQSALVSDEQILGSSAYALSLYTYGDLRIESVMVVLK